MLVQNYTIIFSLGDILEVDTLLLEFSIFITQGSKMNYYSLVPSKILLTVPLINVALMIFQDLINVAPFYQIFRFQAIFQIQGNYLGIQGSYN